MRQFQQKTIAMLLTVFFLLSASLPGVASAERLADEGNSSAAASAAEPEEPETDAETETETLEEEDVPLAGGTKGGARGSTSVLASVGDHIAAAVGVNSVTYEFEDNDLSVTVRANTDALPEDVTLEVVDLSAPRQSDEAKKDYHARQAACSEAKELLDQQLVDEKQRVKDVQAYDIHFVTPDGKEVQPSKAVQVSMRFKNKLNLDGAENQKADVQMAHILEQEKQVEQVDAELELSKDGAVKEAGFAAESFSVYVVYTVDFSYLTNGDNFAYSIRGGTAIGLKELLPLLGVVFDDTTTDTDEVESFVRNIADVTFSNESLVKVAQITQNTTLGQIKKDWNLSPEYSGKMNETQLAQMDAMTFTAPDWALISLKPFQTEETLALTMNNGETVTIEVTDQASDGNWEVWFDGTLGQSAQSNKFYAGATNIRVTCSNGNTVTLPTTAGNPYNNNGYYKLYGWYDVTHNKWYAPGATSDSITGDTVFYADWVPRSYDKGPSNNATVIDTKDTTGFVKTEMFDYNELINTNFCSTPRLDVNFPNPRYLGAPNLHSETWNANNEFAFISWNYNWNPQNSIGMPGNRQDGSEYRQKNLTTGIYGRNTTLINNLFNDTAMVGKTVVGEGNYLFDYNETTKEYFYDSGINAATYNQNDKRFYVYDQHEYLRHSDGNLFNNFLPFNDYPGGTTPDENTGATNYWFGMKNTISFYLPDDVGKTVNGGNVVELDDGTKKDMVFKFSGDDDVWVFVDGELVLDLGGIHDRAGGEINFNTGKVVTYFGTITDYEKKTSDLYGETEINTPAVTALKEGNHTLTVLYLERGSSLSNCAIYFNLLPQPVTVEKQLDGLTEEDRKNYKDKEFQYLVYVKSKGEDNFSLYSTSSDADNHKASYKKNDGSTEKISITNGQVTLKATESVTIPYLKPTDEVYIVEKSLNMAQFETPTAVRYYNDLKSHDSITLTGSGENSAKDWTTEHFSTVDAEKYVFTNRLKEREIKVNKQWFAYDSNEPQNDHIGKTITYTVAARYGEAGHEQVADVSQLNSNGVDTSFEMSDRAGWTQTFSHLPVCTPNGDTITYTVKEQEVKGYTTTYDGNTTDNVTIKNKQNPPAQITVKKEWYDAKGNIATTHPTNITYEVYQFSHKHQWGVWVKEDGENVWKLGEWIKDPDATEKSTGTAHQVCKYDSSHTRTVELGTKDHDLRVKEHKDSTCTEQGYNKFVCNNQDCEVYTAEHPLIVYLDLKEHTWGEPVETDPTCTQPGRITRECSVCHTKETRLGAPALGHDWGDWVIDQVATTTVKGHKHRDCQRQNCSVREDEDIEMLTNVYPGTSIPLDEILNWPTEEEYPEHPAYEGGPERNTQITFGTSGIFKYGNDYYVIYTTFSGNACQYFSGPGNNNMQNNVAKLTGRVIYWSNNVNFNDLRFNKGDLYIDQDGKVYVCKQTDTNNAAPHPTTTQNRWYLVYTPPTESNGSSSSNPSPPANTEEPGAGESEGDPNDSGSNGDNQGGQDNTGGQNNTDGQDNPGEQENPGGQGSNPVSGSEENQTTTSVVLTEADKPGQITTKDGTPPAATTTELTLSQLMSNVRVSALNTWSDTDVNAGNKLSKYGETHTLQTTGNTNNWSETINVPLTDDEGLLYTYYVVEKNPAVGGDWIATYEGQDNGLQNNGTVTIKNREKVKDADLTIYKVGQTYSGSQTGETALNGIGFTIYKYTDVNKTTVGPNPYKKEKFTETVESQDGYVMFTGLEPGDYMLVESSPLDGYNTGGPWDINVGTDGTLTLSGDRITRVSGPGTNDNTYTYKITNVPGYALPSAGGSGTYLFTIIGVTIGTTAILLLTGDRRKGLWRKLDD